MNASTTRPTGVRETLSLDGEWSFRFTGPTAKLEGERAIRVPGIWQTQFEGLRNAHGVGVYRKQIGLPKSFADKRVVLVMEGVMHVAHVFVDGALVATSTNGWTDIEVDITDALKGALSFELRVDATVPDDRHKSEGGFSFALGGQAGLVWHSRRHLEAVPARGARSNPSCAGRCAGDAGGSRRRAERARPALQERRFAHRGLAMARGCENRLCAGADERRRSSRSRCARLMSRRGRPDVPNLYEVVVELAEGERVLDRVVRTIGFRRFEAKNGALWLNGAPFYIRGALDQDWYPENDCRPARPRPARNAFSQRQGAWFERAAPARQNPRPAVS